MSAEQLGQWVVQALQLGLWVALPALAASLIAGVASAVVQAATGVVDSALGFVPKLLAVAAALALSGAWMMQRLVGFTLELWRALP